MILNMVCCRLLSYGGGPVRLGGDLCVWLDVFELGQSLLVDLFQMLLQWQVSIGEEPGERWGRVRRRRQKHRMPAY